MSPDRRDRRGPHARYVLFSDEDGAQRAFVGAAEDAYDRLARADAWTTGATIELPQREPVAEVRGLLRRRTPRTPPAATATAVTLALAEAYRAATAEPRAMESLAGCAAGRRAARLMGDVLAELIGGLALLPLAEQRSGADYRQAMRLAAELTALTQATAELGCTDSRGCVALRRPEPGGQSPEDVEVTRVRAMLLRRSKTLD